MPYSNHASRKFVRDTMAPDQTIKETRIPTGQNVDEFVSRQWGGKQIQSNQHLMSARPNQIIGAAEAQAGSGLPAGTKITGMDVEWYDAPANGTNTGQK